MRLFRHSLVITLLLTILVSPNISGYGFALTFQLPNAEENALTLLESLSPEERVGQLFITTFQGMDVETNSQIHDLIVNHHLGGVILKANNNNFIQSQNELRDITDMIRQLQISRWSVIQERSANPLSDDLPLHYVPLFIGTDMVANNYPNEIIISGFTELPNQMAVGATWTHALAEQVGTVIGAEYSAIGINLLLNPSLDVLETPRPLSPSDLGTRSFGGNPFWVGEMGRSYITGVHKGSDNQIVVIAKHFPGNGGADRLPDDEVATVRKSLDQLEEYDLAPFFAVTGDAPSAESTVDGLLTSHVRYQGFQENIRATTRPVSLDPQSFDQLMSLTPIAIWREAGGIMISDDLGSQAVRKFYELTGQEYEARRVAVSAFLAGNDILYLGDITGSPETDQYEAVVSTLEFFAQKYREDPAFAQRVDESALRILTRKFELYPTFNLSYTLPQLSGLEDIGQFQQTTFEVAQNAATLISPSLTDLSEAIPDPPNQNDRIVFISDTRAYKQCSDCKENPILNVEDFRQAVLRLYGPQAAGIAIPYNLSAYSYYDLDVFMEGELDNLQIENDLRRAHWIVFGMLDVKQDVPVSDTLQKLLTDRPDLIQGKRIVVFAFNAPYYLDATDISKISTYYGLYSHTSGFIDVAARLLYRELQPVGSSPVTVPGAGYDLVTATAPDPEQTIPLLVAIYDQESNQGTSTAEQVPTQVYRIGDIIPIRTGAILDSNGNPIPNDTAVNFILTNGGEVSAFPQIAFTKGGIAQAKIQVTVPGLMEIRAESEPAKQSDILQFDIPPENGIIQTTTPIPEPTGTVVPSPTPTQAPIILPIPQPNFPGRPNLLDWFMSSMIILITAYISYRFAAILGQVRWGVRSGFMVVIGGLVAYSYLALNLPGSNSILDEYGAWAVIAIALTGAAIGILATLGWRAGETRLGRNH